MVPKTGGMAFVLEAMGKQFDALLDVTIIYPQGVVSLWELFSGRLGEVIIHIEKIEIPRDLLTGRYLEDDRFRERMQNWVRELWERKDRLISSHLATGSNQASGMAIV